MQVQEGDRNRDKAGIASYHEKQKNERERDES